LRLWHIEFKPAHKVLNGKARRRVDPYVVNLLYLLNFLYLRTVFPEARSNAFPEIFIQLGAYD